MPNDHKQDFPRPDWLLTINEVQCAIYLGADGTSGGIREANSETGRTATVVFQCYWEDRLDLIAGLVGTVDYVGGSITRTQPFVLPVTTADQQNGKMFPKRTFCTSISSVNGTKWQTDLTGDKVADPPLPGWGQYVFALVTAEFTTPSYLIDSLTGDGSDFAFNDIVLGTYTTSKLRVSGEVFSPPGGAFVFTNKFDNNGNNVPVTDIGAAQLRTRFEVSITRMRMPLVPMQTVLPLMGCVNEQPFLVAGQNFPKGALLFNGINPEPRCDPYNGGIIWDIDFQFIGNAPASNEDQTDPLDWNYFLYLDGTWQQVQTKDGGKPVFKYKDIFPLFSNTIN
jgi:hypothetical protein